MRETSCRVRWRRPPTLGPLSLVLLAVAALLAACGSSGSTNGGQRSAPNTNAVDTGAAGNATLTWAKSGEAPGTDPQVTSQAVAADIMWRVYETLVEVDADGTIAPLIARSWDRVSPTVYDFQLRRDVRFSNGRPLTSADVVTTFERVLDPKLGSWYGARLSAVKRVSARGRHAVRFTLARPAGTFLPALTGLGAVILPGKELKAGTFDPAKKMLGTGPFEVKRHLQNQSWLLTRNPHYWRPGYPRVANLKILIINDVNAKMAALRGGRADVATFDDPDSAKLLQDTPNVGVTEQATSQIYALYLNAVRESSKLRDERVRQAIAYSLDREQIVGLALGGRGEPAATGTLGRLADACQPSEFAQRNLDRAEELISAANAGGLKFEITYDTALPVLGRIAQVIQAQLQEAGLNPTVRGAESGAWLDGFLKGDLDMTLTWTHTYADNWFGFQYWSPSALSSFKGMTIDDPHFNDLLEQAAGLEEGAARARVFQEMCDLAARRADVIAFATRPVFVAYREDRVKPILQDLDPNSNPLRTVAEWGKE